MAGNFGVLLPSVICSTVAILPSVHWWLQKHEIDVVSHEKDSSQTSASAKKTASTGPAGKRANLRIGREKSVNEIRVLPTMIVPVVPLGMNVTAID